MHIRLVVIKGPKKGEEFNLLSDSVLGRRKCDIPLEDSRASSEHAKIYSDTNNIIYIRDLGSSNGTFVNGKKVVSAHLKVGDVITIGKTELKLEEPLAEVDTVVDADDTHVETTAASGGEAGGKAEVKKAAKNVTWQEIIASALEKKVKELEKKAEIPAAAADSASTAASQGAAAAITALAAASPEAPSLGATSGPHRPAGFDMPIVLEFVQGLQAGTQWVFGYGPREVGAHCSDGLIYEKGSPAVAFTLTPVKDALCEFFTEHNVVLVNNSKSAKCRLKSGDRISFGQTVIVVKNIEK